MIEILSNFDANFHSTTFCERVVVSKSNFSLTKGICYNATAANIFSLCYNDTVSIPGTTSTEMTTTQCLKIIAPHKTKSQLKYLFLGKYTAFLSNKVTPVMVYGTLMK